jgi:hypothetical protein
VAKEFGIVEQTLGNRVRQERVGRGKKGMQSDAFDDQQLPLK